MNREATCWATWTSNNDTRALGRARSAGLPRCVGGTLALIHGDAGARGLGWDTTAIQHAALDGQIAQTRLDEATRRIGQLDLDDRALRDAPIEPRIPRGPLDDSAAIQVMVARDAAREIREGERDRIADELKLLNGDRLEAIGLVNAAASSWMS